MGDFFFDLVIQVLITLLYLGVAVVGFLFNLLMISVAKSI